MSLLDRIAHVASGDASREEIEAFLVECATADEIEGLAAVQQVFASAKGGAAHSLTWLAGLTLLHWGEQGLDALVRVAIRSTKIEIWSRTLALLSKLSVDELPLWARFALLPGALQDKLVPALQQTDWPTIALPRLRRLVSELPETSGAALALGFAFQDAVGPNISDIRPFVGALAIRWLGISQPIIDRYLEMIRSQPNDEPAFHALFEQVPQLLDPMVLDVWSKPNLLGTLEPDFVIQRVDGSYLIVEIETPAKAIVTKAGQLSSDASHAVKQANEYLAFLQEHIAEVRETFPDFRNAECLVVVGIEDDLTPEFRRALVRDNMSRNRLRVVGFDWLVHRATTIRENLILREIPTEIRARVP